MIYIKSIIEPDFGCEEVPEDKPICDKIVFVVEGDEQTYFIPEKLVWESRIDEGMTIDEELFKSLKTKAYYENNKQNFY